jgi:acyl-CoA thioesterase FadM
MYPIARLAKEMIKFRNAPKLGIDEIHVSTHMCWPVDIDIFGELNNGRTLTIYDLGRLIMGKRMGLLDCLRENNWGMTMAGASVRYRRRVRVFQKFTVKTSAIGRDDRFLYLLQTMWRKEEATSSVLYRTAITDKNGIVPTQQVAQALGFPDWNPDMPEWVLNWIKAEASRQWPPER